MFFNKKKKKDCQSKEFLPNQDPTSIGYLIVESGIIRKDKFLELLSLFNELEQKEKLLGQFIMGRTNMTQQQLDYLLIKQYVMRKTKASRAERLNLDHRDIMRSIEIVKKTQANCFSEINRLSMLTTLIK